MGAKRKEESTPSPTSSAAGRSSAASTQLPESGKRRRVPALSSTETKAQEKPVNRHSRPNGASSEDRLRRKLFSQSSSPPLPPVVPRKTSPVSDEDSPPHERLSLHRSSTLSDGVGSDLETECGREFVSPPSSPGITVGNPTPAQSSAQKLSRVCQLMDRDGFLSDSDSDVGSDNEASQGKGGVSGGLQRSLSGQSEGSFSASHSPFPLAQLESQSSREGEQTTEVSPLEKINLRAEELQENLTSASLKSRLSEAYELSEGAKKTLKTKAEMARHLAVYEVGKLAHVGTAAPRLMCCLGSRNPSTLSQV